MVSSNVETDSQNIKQYAADLHSAERQCSSVACAVHECCALRVRTSVLIGPSVDRPIGPVMQVSISALSFVVLSLYIYSGGQTQCLQKRDYVCVSSYCTP